MLTQGDIFRRLRLWIVREKKWFRQSLVSWSQFFLANFRVDVIKREPQERQVLKGLLETSQSDRTVTTSILWARNSVWNLPQILSGSRFTANATDSNWTREPRCKFKPTQLFESENFAWKFPQILSRIRSVKKKRDSNWTREPRLKNQTYTKFKSHDKKSRG